MGQLAAKLEMFTLNGLFSSYRNVPKRKPRGREYRAKIQRKHGKAKSLTIMPINLEEQPITCLSDKPPCKKISAPAAIVRGKTI